MTPGGPADQEESLPIHILREQERTPSPDFLVKVRRKIHRRTAASQVASFSWHMPRLVLLEMADVLRELFTAIGGRKGSQP